MAQEFISVTAIDTGGIGDSMSRNFSTTFKGTENEHMLKAMVLDWEKTEVQPKYRRYRLITSDFIEEFSNEIQETLEELEIEN